MTSAHVSRTLLTINSVCSLDNTWCNTSWTSTKLSSEPSDLVSGEIFDSVKASKISANWLASTNSSGLLAHASSSRCRSCGYYQPLNGVVDLLFGSTECERVSAARCWWRKTLNYFSAPNDLFVTNSKRLHYQPTSDWLLDEKKKKKNSSRKRWLCLAIKMRR